MNYEDKLQLAKKLLLDFEAYVRWIHKIAQGGEYDMTPAHSRLCAKLQEYAEGRNKKRNLMVNVSPGFGKSLLLQYFITWCFARNKNCMFCYIAYGERLIKKLSRESRNLMMSPEWEELFGKEMDPGDKSVLNYHLISGGVRSGLTAGTISSAILGLDAGNPSNPDDEVGTFSGALLLDDINSPEVRTSVHEQYEVPETYQRKLATRRRRPNVPTICIMQRHCFLPDTVIWTEDGKKTIKDIVEHKYSGRVWSYNPETDSYELKKIEAYIKNSPLRQKVFNIAGVWCTGEHRVCTQRGVVLARNVKAGDKLIHAPDSLNNANGYTNSFRKAFLVSSYITNSVKFILGKIAWHAKCMWCDSGNAAVGFAAFNRSDNTVWRTVFDRKSFKVGLFSGYLSGLFGSKLRGCSYKGYAAVAFCIFPVFPVCAVLQVIHSVVRWVIIKMANNAFPGAFSNESLHDKVVNPEKLVKPVFTKRNLDVAATPRRANKLISLYAKNAAFIRNAVKAFIANNIFEDFVHVISSIKTKTFTGHTYCITVADNHTLIAGTTQGFVFGNCENDFAGWVEKSEIDEWEFFIVPALDENGESYYPKRYPKAELERIQKQNPYLFAAMYQQKPLANAGLYFHEEWIRTYRVNPEKFQKVFITTDFGFTTTGDKSLFCCWGLANDNNLYLLRSLQGKWESPDAKKNCIDFFKRCAMAYKQCRRVYVEQTLSGIGFIQDMKRECPAMAIVPLRRGAKKNKLNRAESAMTWMEGGRVYIREGDPNYVSARAEFLAYNPADKNPKDEWIDNTGDACEIAFNQKTSSIFV